MVSGVVAGIKKIITEKGLKQGYVAHKADFDKSQFSNLLHGKRVLRAEDLPRIANALGVSIADIYEAGKEEKEEEE